VEEEQLVGVAAACTWDFSRDSSDLDASRAEAAVPQEVHRREELGVEVEPWCETSELDVGVRSCELGSWPQVEEENGLQQT
jgi:hypothetical protein